MSLTDADGDFLRYDVDVTAIRLTKADGSAVDVLAQEARVDFAQLTNFAHFISNTAVPAGVYTGVTLTLDYTDADIEVEKAGVPVKATPVLPNGGTTIDAQVRFADGSPLTVGAGALSHLVLDFNLAASNVADVTKTPPTVQVSPFLAVDANFQHPMTHQARGLLQSVDTASKTFVLEIKPFGMPMSSVDFSQVGQSGTSTGAWQMGPSGWMWQNVTSTGSGQTGTGAGVWQMGPGGSSWQMGMGGWMWQSGTGTGAVQTGTGQTGSGTGGTQTGTGSGVGQTGMGGWMWQSGYGSGSGSMMGSGGGSGYMGGGSIMYRQAAAVPATSTAAFGSITVVTNDQTTFEVEGVARQGAAGLSALAGQTAGTPVSVIGSVDAATRRLVARQVYAGYSVPGVGADTVTGNVTARQGNVLTVRRAIAECWDGSLGALVDLQVTLSDTTAVAREGDSSTTQRTIGEISVGQRITAFGTLSRTAAPFTLDATQGRVRLLSTNAAGRFVSSSGGHLTMQLQQLNGIPVDRFDFTGTAADPSAYDVAVGTLPVSDLSAGAPIRVAGFVTPFGDTSADFTASSVTRLATAPTTLRALWNPATASGVTVVSTSEIDLQLASATAAVMREGVSVPLTGTAKLFPAAATGAYWLQSSAGTTRYADFGSYATALQTSLSGGANVYSLTAVGTFDTSSQQVHATVVVVKVQ